MVVDDDADYRGIISEFLRAEGYDVEEVGDGEQAMDLLARSPAPGLILLDLQMPRCDGWTVFVWLKAHQRLRNVPVVVMTAIPAKQRVVDRINQDGPYWLTKPFELEVLRYAVKAHCP